MDRFKSGRFSLELRFFSTKIYYAKLQPPILLLYRC